MLSSYADFWIYSDVWQYKTHSPFLEFFKRKKRKEEVSTSYKNQKGDKFTFVRIFY